MWKKSIPISTKPMIKSRHILTRISPFRGYFFGRTPGSKNFLVPENYPVFEKCIRHLRDLKIPELSIQLSLADYFRSSKTREFFAQARKNNLSSRVPVQESLELLNQNSRENLRFQPGPIRTLACL